ncbi:MAG: PKD domain-containing protein, partial [Bacteroidota bacterium]
MPAQSHTRRWFFFPAAALTLLATVLTYHHLVQPGPGGSLGVDATIDTAEVALADLERTGGWPGHIRSSFSPKNREGGIKRQRYELQRLQDPRTGEIPLGIRARELALARQMPASDLLGAGKQAASWQLRGPFNVGGRTRALAIDLDYNGTSNRRILAGGISGGVFLSEDGGASWQLTTSLEASPSVSSIAQDPNQRNIWYHGTGEFLGASAGGVGGNWLSQGIAKSTDGGRSWSILPSTLQGNSPTGFDSLFDFVWNVKVHPQGSVVLAATFGGIFRSTDGGASFQQVLGQQTSPFNRITDVAIGADGAVYATLSRNGSGLSTYGVFRSTDVGQTWSNISPPTLGNDPYRMVLAPAPSDPGTLYLVVQANQQGAKATDHQLFRLQGGTWSDLSGRLPTFTQPGPQGQPPIEGIDSFNSQGGYDLVAHVKPDNPNVVWIGGNSLYRSTDGGQTFEQVGGYANHYEVALYDNQHPDQHSIAFYPGRPNSMITGHDGGLSTTDNSLQSPQRWTSLNNGYLTSQFYTIAIDPQAGSNTIIGGLQDNGTWRTDAVNGTSPWSSVFGGDGSYTALVPGGNPFYVSSQNGAVIRADIQGNNLVGTFIQPQGATNFLFIAPFHLDPADPRVMYLAAGSQVWRNSNLDQIPTGNGQPTTVNWSPLTRSEVAGTQVTMSASTTVPAGRLYVGATDFQSRTVLTRVDDPAGNGPGVNITPPGVAGGSFPAGFGINPQDGDEVLATFSNYRVPSLFYTTDGGTSWQDVEGNLGGEDGPSVRWAAIVPSGTGKVYFVATSTGLYSTTTLNGANTVWAKEGAQVIGNVVVDMIASRPEDGLVVVGTHGRGVYSASITPAGQGGGGGGAAVAAVNVGQIDLAVGLDGQREASFDIQNTGGAPLTYTLTARDPQDVPPSASPAASALRPPVKSLADPGPRLRFGDQRGDQRGPLSTPAQSGEAAPAGADVLALSAGDDVLFLDDGDASADTFFGWGPDGATQRIPFVWMNGFNTGAQPFSLEAVQFFMRTEFEATNAPTITVYDGDLNERASGSIALQTSQAGMWYEVELDQPLAFGAGEDLFIEIDAVNTALDFPAGTDCTATVTGQSFFYDWDTGLYQTLTGDASCAVPAFLIRARGTAGGGGGGTNQPPVADIRVSPLQGGVGETLTFDASGSTDADGQIVSYLWSFGDGTTSTQSVTTHAYAAAGTYAL